MTVAKATYEGPAESLERYDAVVAAAPGLERTGAKTPYTSRNGHMFSFLDAAGVMALRLAEDKGAEFRAAYESGPVEQHGRVMKGYVAVPTSLLADIDELRPWLEASHAWIGTLKPKATTRSKKSSRANKG